jgi:hypothetical protein
MKTHQTVLCIQDGTDLNYTGLAQCDGLGVMGQRLRIQSRWSGSC